MDRHISGADNRIGKNPELSIRSLNFPPQTAYFCASLKFPHVVRRLEKLPEKHHKYACIIFMYCITGIFYRHLIFALPMIALK